MINSLFNPKKKHLLVVPIHGTKMQFYCNLKVLLDDIRDILRYFIDRQGTTRGSSLNCTLHMLNEKEYKQYQKQYTIQKLFEASPDTTATLGAIFSYTAYELKSCCLIIFDDKTNDCACLLQRTANKKIIPTDLIIHILLIEWLRGKGMFFIHSGGVCQGGKAYLFLGPSGAGKTTAALMGVQRGLSFMGDDLLMVRGNGKRISALAYIEDVKFCLDMTGKFHELKSIDLKGGRADRNRKSVKFDVGDYFDLAITDRASVIKIFFLQKGQALKRLKTSEALPLLMDNSYFFSRPDVSAKHFEVLCRLIDSVDSYQVGHQYLNRHFEELLKVS